LCTATPSPEAGNVHGNDSEKEGIEEREREREEEG
jgi:hypothetical protein